LANKMKRSITRVLWLTMLLSSTVLGGDDPLFRIEEDGKWGFINRSGDVVIEPRYEDCYYQFSEGLAAVKTNGKWGYIDSTNQMLIAARFDGAQSFKGGIAAVRVGRPFEGEGKWGYIDKTGKYLFEPTDALSYSGFSDGLMPVRKGEKWGYLNTKGEWAIPSRFADANDFSEGLAGVQDAGSTAGFIDLNGNWVIRLDDAVPHYYGFSEGLASVLDNKTGLFGYVEKSGDWVIPPKFSGATCFSGGCAAVQITTKDESGWPARHWGVINKDGEMIVEPKFENIWPFEEGMAVAILDGKWGFLDVEGNLAIPCKFDSGTDFYKGLAYMRMGSDLDTSWSGYINKQGEYVWCPKDFAEKDKARAKAKAKADELAEEANPSIKILIGKDAKGKGLRVTYPSKIPFEGEGAGEIPLTVVNLLEDDVFLEVTGNESCGASLDYWNGGFFGGGGSFTIFPGNTNLLKLVHATRYKGDESFTCGCCITRTKAKINPAALKSGRARGTVSVSFAGYYRSTGKHFFEIVDLPIELVEQTDGQQDGADQPATAPESKSQDNQNTKPESEVRPQ
jgi:hypothetical protein